jgi:DNA-directed RNA polymerase subunit N (RpoN/RPB10)
MAPPCCFSCGRYIADYQRLVLAIKTAQNKKQIMDTGCEPITANSMMDMTPVGKILDALGIPKFSSCCRMHIFTISEPEKEYGESRGEQ